MSTAPRGDDLVFHLNRIRSLACSINDGNFYPYIFRQQNFEFGYALPLFYSNLFLYPSALLNLAGISVIDSYKVLIYFCTFFSCLSVAYFISNFTKKQSTIFIGISFYIFSGYRITDCYARAALGEVLSFIFLPIVYCGLYYIFYKKSSNWWILTLGYTGLILSHNISFVFGCMIFMIFFLINLKYIIKDRKILLKLFFSFIYAVGLSAFFLFPMLEQISSLSIGNGKNPINFMITLSEMLGLPRNNYIFSPGICLLVLPMFFYKNFKNNQYIKITFICSWIAMALTVIPIVWKISILSFIQFPWRLNIIACISLLPSFIISYDLLKDNQKKILIFVGILCSFTYMICQLNKDHLSTAKDNELNIDNISTPFGDSFPYSASELSGAEYLINKTFNYRYAVRKIETYPVLDYEISFSEHKGVLTFKSDSMQANITYILPVSYYKGYIVEIDNHIIYPYPDYKNHFLTFQLSKENANKLVKVYYDSTRIQKISCTLSIVTLGVLLFTIYKQINGVS